MDGRSYALLLDVTEHDSIDGWPSITLISGVKDFSFHFL